MYRTVDTIQEAMSFMALDEGVVLERIRQCSIKLEAPGFTASGVLCKTGMDGHLKERALIATSKRNLLRKAGYPHDKDPPAFGDYEIKPLLKDFVEQIIINYASGRRAAINHLAIFEPDWSCDLLLLISYDEDLVRTTRKYGMVADLGKVREHRRHFSGRNRELFTRVQAGFGAGDQTPGDEIHYRITDLLEGDPLTVKQQETVEGCFQHIFLIDADPENTMAEGDEGGPLFAVFSDEEQDPEIYLMGVNLGANYGKDLIPSDSAIINNAVTDTRPVIEKTFLELDHSA